MKKILAFTIPLLVVSCGGGSSPTTGAQGSTEVKIDCAENITSAATSNSIQITVKNDVTNEPLKGVVVQIDHNGLCIFTDKFGEAHFDNLSVTTLHDIHIFGQNGFEWKSFYDVPVSNSVATVPAKVFLRNSNETAAIKKPPATDKSYTLFSGNITKSNRNVTGTTNPDNKIVFKYFSDVAHRVKSEVIEPGLSPAAYDLEYGFTEVERTQLKHELWVFETSIDTATGYETLSSANLVPPVYSETTPNNISEVNQITLPLNTHADANFLKFNTFGLPNVTGIESSFLKINAQFQATTNAGATRQNDNIDIFQTTKKPVDATVLLTAAIPSTLNIVNLNITVTAKNTSGVTWTYTDSIPYNVGLTSAMPANAGIVFAPVLTSIPTLHIPDANTIKWSSANVVVKNSSLQILRGVGVNLKRWSFEIKEARTDVLLPDLPAGLEPLLVEGESYGITLQGKHRYNSNISGVNAETAAESYSSQIFWKYSLK